ncbi:22585_t:CDS:2 [Dentiscutata erythropus]|uniref:22585_t:CDS:1 n=1 Tax=Dentiscutata erythropus TaxID=1348616 RepID=A0A9N8Z0F0_9GLOM|nr:22585_t:CDS:2 [Dentiscutata erythropus]
MAPALGVKNGCTAQLICMMILAVNKFERTFQLSLCGYCNNILNRLKSKDKKKAIKTTTKPDELDDEFGGMS